MSKIALSQLVIVEGKYDKIRLSSLLDAVILTTEGFGLYRDAEKRALLRRLALERGAILMTDPDRAGFQIRGHLKSLLAGAKLWNVYLPDILGKERRKSRPGAEGKLGVEGMETHVLLEALSKAGVVPREDSQGKGTLSKADFFALGLSGGPDSAVLRTLLARHLGLPARISSNGLLEAVNLLFTRAQLEDALRSVQAGNSR